jgi:ABC-type branched-subunit amino acid transport system ATPase component
MTSAEPPKNAGKPLLEVDKLTLRFRGLTAVNAVDLGVQENQIFAVIGPNGAGKTSLFNAITGIYEPTEGVVRLEGEDLRKQPQRSNYVRWGLVGLAVGLLLFLVSSDVNQMWSAVVKANFVSRKEGFQVSQAFRDLAAFAAAKPRIEPRAGRFYVTTSDGRTPFGSAKTREDAEKKRAAIPGLAKAPQDGSTVTAEADGNFATHGADGAVLDVAPTREVAIERIAAARDVAAEQAAAVRKRILALLFGIVVGTAAASAVWQQTRRTPTSVAARGIARTFQNIRLFQDMTVVENVLVGMDRHLDVQDSLLSRVRLVDFAPLAALSAAFVLFFCGLRFEILPAALTGVLLMLVLAGAIVFLVSIFRRGYFSPSAQRVEAKGRTEALALLEFVGLTRRADDLAKNLPYGDQRRLEIARALATKPKLLLLDEPAAGMNPAETVSLMKLIKDIRDRGTTVLLIEHHMRVVMGISDRIAVLVYGQKIAEGTPDEIRANPKVVEAYLGQEQLG